MHEILSVKFVHGKEELITHFPFYLCTLFTVVKFTWP